MHGLGHLFKLLTCIASQLTPKYTDPSAAQTASTAVCLSAVHSASSRKAIINKVVGWIRVRSLWRDMYRLAAFSWRHDHEECQRCHKTAHKHMFKL